MSFYENSLISNENEFFIEQMVLSEELKEIKVKFQNLQNTNEKLVTELKNTENIMKRDKDTWVIERDALKKTIHNYEELIKNLNELNDHKSNFKANYGKDGNNKISKEDVQSIENLKRENEFLKKEIEEYIKKNEEYEKERTDYEKLKVNIFELSVEFDNLRLKHSKTLEDLMNCENQIQELHTKISNDREMYFKIFNTTTNTDSTENTSPNQFNKRNINNRNKRNSVNSRLQTLDNNSSLQINNYLKSYTERSPDSQFIKRSLVNNRRKSVDNPLLNKTLAIKDYSPISKKLDSNDNSCISNIMFNNPKETILSEVNKNKSIGKNNEKGNKTRIESIYKKSLVEANPKNTEKLEKESKNNVKESKKKENKIYNREGYELKIKDLKAKLKEEAMKKLKIESSLNQRIEKYKEESIICQKTINNLTSINKNLDISFKDIKAQLEISHQENTLYSSQIYLKNLEVKKLNENNDKLLREIISLKEKIKQLDTNTITDNGKDHLSVAICASEPSKLKDDYEENSIINNMKYKYSYDRKNLCKIRTSKSEGKIIQEDYMRLIEKEMKKSNAEIKFLSNQIEILKNEYENKLSFKIQELDSLLNENDYLKTDNISLKANIANLTFEKENIEIKSKNTINYLKSHLYKKNNINRKSSI